MQTDLFSAQEVTEAAIKVAVDHADAVHSNWSDKAYDMFKLYLESHERNFSFMGEDFRIWTEFHGLALPPHKRAYGGIVRRASHEGLIRRTGYQKVKTISSHQATASVWRKNI